MDGNLQHLRPRIVSDQIETSLDTSGITENNYFGSDLVELEGEEEEEEIVTTTTPSDNQMAVSLSTEWTDEKHRLYLSSMEATFVKQLFSHEYCSMNMLVDRSSRGRTKPDPNSFRQLNVSSEQPSSGQFKVLQSGHWKQLNNFGRTQPRLDVVVDESPPENHWIQRYRPGRRHQEVTSPKTATTTVVATSSKRFSHLYHQEESVGSSTEVSDQNFSIEDHKGEQFSRAKRMKTTSVDDSTGVDDSNKDQVVPL